MSFNRKKHDLCDYSKSTYQSTSALSFALDPSRHSRCDKCRIPFGIVGGNEVQELKYNLVDLESELRNQTRHNSKCPCKKYLPAMCIYNNAMNSNCVCSLENKNIMTECNLINFKPKITTSHDDLRYPSCYKIKKRYTNVSKPWWKFW